MRLRLYFESVLDDLRFAVRSFRRSPGFTLTALLAISLGVGASTAVFSVVDRVLFRPLPYENAGRLVSLGMVAKVVGENEFLFAADYKDLLESRTPFQAMTSWSGVSDCDLTDREPVRQQCVEVESNFLTVFGVKPLLGEGFRKEDGQPNAPSKAILSYGLWKSRFGGDRGIVGQTMQLDGKPERIAGVLPPSFELPTLQHADLLVPQVVLDSGWQHSATRVLWVFGQLRNGTTMKQALPQLAPAFERMRSYVPAPFRKQIQFRARTLRDRQMERATAAAWTSFGAVLAVLLISCANVANLLLARGVGRKAEIAVREALGAGQFRLARQMITESLALATAGGALGCVLATVLLRLAVAEGPGGLPYLSRASLDGRALAFSLISSCITGLVFGVVPALQSRRVDAMSEWRSTASRRSSTLKNMLVAGQIAISTVLLASAGLLARSLWNLETQPLGISTQHVLTGELVLPSGRYKKPEERIAFFNLVEQKLGEMPGLRAFGLSDSLPPGGWERSRPLSVIGVRGQARHQTGTGGLVAWRYVTPGFFTTLRIPVVEGRVFNEEDRRPGETLCMVSRSLARSLFKGQTPLGEHLRFGPDGAWARVVGVAADVKNAGLVGQDNPEYYILRTHAPDETYLHGTGPVAQRTLSFVLRSALPENTLDGLVRRAIAALDPSQPVEIKSMRGRMAELVEQPRFHAVLLISFAAVGLFLAAVGLYGTVAFLVTQRTREIGIRMAVGATPSDIAAVVLKQSAAWTFAGAMAGVLLTLGATRLLSSFLFGVSARDPLTLVTAVAVLLTVALAASANPARRAARVDPATALRNG